MLPASHLYMDADRCRGLVHSADDKELDDLERYLKEQIPPLGDVKKEESL